MPGQFGPVTKLDSISGNLSAFIGILAVPLPYGAGMQIAGEEGGVPFLEIFLKFSFLSFIYDLNHNLLKSLQFIALAFCI